MSVIGGRPEKEASLDAVLSGSSLAKFFGGTHPCFLWRLSCHCETVQ